MSLKERFANNVVRRRTRRNKKALTFNDVIKSSNSAIFLMPRLSLEFYLARSVVESFMKYFRRAVLLVSDNMRELATYRNEIIVFSQSDTTWLKLPKRDLISRLHRENFDIAFDMSHSEDLFMSYLCYKSDAKMTVGFTKNDSDRYYDLQIRTQRSDDMKKAYELLANTIKMFKEK